MRFLEVHTSNFNKVPKNFVSILLKQGNFISCVILIVSFTLFIFQYLGERFYKPCKHLRKSTLVGLDLSGIVPHKQDNLFKRFKQSHT